MVQIFGGGVRAADKVKKENIKKLRHLLGLSFYKDGHVHSFRNERLGVPLFVFQSCSPGHPKIILC